MRYRVGLQILTLFAAVALLAAAASADEPGTAVANQRALRLQHKLGLTDDQTRAIGAIYSRNAADWRELGQRLRATRADLRRLVLESADEGAIQARQTELQALVAEALQRRTSTLREIVQILTPAQREQYAQLLDHLADHLRHHGHHRRHS